MAMTGNTRTTSDRSPIRLAALVVGATFLLIGILGFIPGITTDYGEMQFAGHESEAMLLGLFQVSILHNIVHLAFGVVGLLAARSITGSRYFLGVGGLIYLVLWLFGTVVEEDSDANFVPLNNADDWLHFGLGVGMILLAVMLWRNARQPLGH